VLDRTAVKSRGLPPMVYLYDGSFEGLLCCVYESYVSRQPVTDIVPTWEAQATLYAAREIETSETNAARVYASLEKKLGGEGRNLVTTAFLFGGEEKAMDIYRFIAMGYETGPTVSYMLGDEVVSRIHKMNRSITHEAHILTGFVRFSQCDLGELPMLSATAAPAYPVSASGEPSRYRPTGALAAVIEPKHNVLPLMSHHFCSRYPEERFIIFDKTNKQALVYEPYKVSLVAMDSLELPPAEDEEALCQRLWKGYYDSVSIKARENPKCRMAHMPKRLWKHILEVQSQ